jgi:hypothetical protein
MGIVTRELAEQSDPHTLQQRTQQMLNLTASTGLTLHQGKARFGN